MRWLSRWRVGRRWLGRWRISRRGRYLEQYGQPRIVT
jgi:hypothetical protein